MLDSLYQRETRNHLHRGAVYQYRPISWFERPPIWIVRNITWDPVGQGDLYYETDLHDAFRVGGNEEDVVVRAKLRTVVILSTDAEASSKGIKEVSVIPAYTITSRLHPTHVARIKAGEYPDLFYLPLDRNFHETGERYLNFRKVHVLHKDFFMEQNKASYGLSRSGVSQVLGAYGRYLGITIT